LIGKLLGGYKLENGQGRDCQEYMFHLKRV
jgi:hypothetical protein